MKKTTNSRVKEKRKLVPLYLQDEWVTIIKETANDVCGAKGWANRVKDNDVIPILMALYILKTVMKAKK